MNTQSKQTTAAPVALAKADLNLPALVALGPMQIAIRAGTVFGGRTFEVDTPVPLDAPLAAGADYAVIVVNGGVGYARLTQAPADPNILGGFHFAPGGNAGGRNGGDTSPAINPFSLWDLSFRPACPDPRGMALVEKSGGRFWCDIYLTGTNHLADGTSKLGATVADGDDLPDKPGGGTFDRFDYDAACALMAHHGKGLLSLDEFFAAAYGVTEKTARRDEPERTQIDAPRTSKFGLMQATGNMWVWGHDGDPDNPRASFFGGSWLDDDVAGSRLAHVASIWPDFSDDLLGARGRSDHLQPV